MKNFENIKGTLKIALVCALFVPFALLYSCVEDDELNGGMVELLSFGPSGVKHGEKIKFIGHNMDRVTAIILPNNVEVQSSQFATKTRELIEITVPLAAEAGKVVLKTPQGDIVSKTMLNFDVPVVISNMTAEVKPGENLTITGTLINWIEEVVFYEGLAVTEFVSKSLTELVVKVPINAQTGNVLFRSGGTKPLSFVSPRELKVSLPAVTSIEPAAARHTSNITLIGTNLDLVTSIVFGGDFTVSNFISKSATQIVVAVPAGALKGKLTLKQLSPVDVLTSQELGIVLPTATSILPAVAVPGVDNVTITGTDLDLVASLAFVGVPGGVPASTFVSQSSTQIVLLLPDGAKTGGINYTTIHQYSNSLGASVVTPGPGPQPLPLVMYDETLAPGGGDWSWNVALSDPASTEQFYSGTVSWKFTTNSDGGVSSGGMNPINASNMEYFSFSVYGGPGTNGKQIAAILNDNWGNFNSVTLVEGQWTEYKIPLSNYPGVDKSAIVRWILRVEGMNGYTIFVDRIGFEPGGPAPLPLTIFDEAIAPGGGDWSWNVVLSDMANKEQVYLGEVSWKYQTNSGGGMSSGGLNPIDASGMTYFSFALFGGPGTDGAQVACILNDNWNDYNSVNIVEGKWTEYKIPLANYATTNKSAIVRFAFKPEINSSIFYADRVGFE